VEAVRLFRLAAAAGHPDAHCNLGRCYYLGEGGLPQDEAEAVRLFLLAAEHGDPVAQYNLGICAEHGHGGLPEEEEEEE
jgi:TPR repeat protein